MPTSPQDAAAALARELRVPSWKGTVVVWDTNGVVSIVVAVDEDWLKGRPGIPETFMGYPVRVSERLRPLAGIHTE